jgi:hypothetical protein
VAATLRRRVYATERADRTRRSFLTKSYPTMKKHNPYTPILIREASGTEPKLYARYGASLPAAGSRGSM